MTPVAGFLWPRMIAIAEAFDVDDHRPRLPPGPELAKAATTELLEYLLGPRIWMPSWSCSSIFSSSGAISKAM